MYRWISTQARNACLTAALAVSFCCTMMEHASAWTENFIPINVRDEPLGQCSIRLEAENNVRVTERDGRITRFFDPAIRIRIDFPSSGEAHAGGSEISGNEVNTLPAAGVRVALTADDLSTECGFLNVSNFSAAFLGTNTSTITEINLLFRATIPNGATAFASAGDVTGDGTTQYDFVYRLAGPADGAPVLTATVTAVTNVAPIITSNGGGDTAAVNVAENTIAVTNVETNDDNDTEGAGLTYSLSGGADQAAFSIDASGNLTFNAAPDFETPQDAGGNNVYDVQVTVTDSGNLTDIQDIAVTVGNVNEDATAPTVSILNAPANHDRSTPFNITVEFSEDVTNFVAGDITVANATLSNFVAVDGNTYTVDITPSGPQDITLNVAAAVAQDAAGNDNTAATQVTIVSSIVEETQQVIATFLNNRANHILSNQPSLSGFVSGANSQGGGAAGNLALNATTGSQVLAFSTSRSKILAGVRQAHARALGGIRGDHNNQLSPDTSNDPLSVFTRQKEEPSQSTNASTQSYGLGGDTLDLQSGADLIANQRQAADAVIDDDGNALTQTSRAGTYDVWTEIYGSNTNAGTSESRLWVAYLGAHYFVDDNTLFGVLGQIDWSEETNSATGSNAEGQGWAIGPYIAGQLPGQNLFYEARASWGTSDNDVSPVGTFTDNFDTTRFLATGKVSGSIAHETYKISPSVSVAYYEETQETYTDTLGNLIPEQTVSLGEVRFGPDISRSVELDDGTLFTPSVGVSGVFNFGIEDNAASQGFALGNDDFRARVDAGFSATNPDTGLTLSVDGFYDGIGIDDFDSYGGRVRVTVPLN